MTPSPTYNVASRLLHMAEDRAQLNSFTTDGRSLTFDAFGDQALRAAAGLRAMGVAPGDRVVVFVPMSVELYVLLGAIFAVGAVAVFIDPWMEADKIRSAARLSAPKCFIGVAKSHLLRLRFPELRSAASAVVVGRSIARFLPKTTTFERLVAMREPIDAVTPVEKGDHALITFTSGSTGAPKGADRTHDFLHAQTTVLERHLALKPGDVHYTNLPIFALHNIAVGATTAMAPPALAQEANPRGSDLLAQVSACHPTVVTLSPTPLWALLTAAHEVKMNFPDVHHVYTGGGPVLPGMLEHVAEVFPAATCEVLYGSTECEPIAHLGSGDLIASTDAIKRQGGIPVGHVVPETRVRLTQPIDGQLPVEATANLAAYEVERGTAGEVLVAGAHVNRGYYHAPEATAENKVIEPDGTLWHRTGDVARIDDNGDMWLLGRVGSEVEVAPDMTAWPLEISTALEALDGIDRVALVRHGGQSVLAVATANSPTSGDVARDWLSARGFSSVKVVEVNLIPMDGRHAAKVDTAHLVQMLR